MGSREQSPQILKGLELTCVLGNHPVLLIDKASRDWRSWVCFCREATSGAGEMQNTEVGHQGQDKAEGKTPTLLQGSRGLQT